MALRPMVLMADAILKTPTLAARHAQTARRYLAVSEAVFSKWDERGCWRQVTDGGVWVVPPFGIDAKTGQEVWVKRLGGEYWASPIYADGKIYLQDEKGKGTVLKPGKKFEKIGQSDLGEDTLASYAAGDGALFIRTEKHLYKIAAGKKK